MKMLILFASAVAMLAAAPSSAKPGKGNPQDHGTVGPVGYGTGSCPPGLRNKNPACMPPGRYKKLFEVGQRVPVGYNGLLGYNQLPYDLRDRYSSVLDPRSRYIFDQGYLYRVDPTTMVVSQILQTLLR